MTVSDSLRTNFSVIGSSIIYSRPEGKADLEGVKNTLSLKQEIIQHIATENRPYIQIQDYSSLAGSSQAARSWFIKSGNEDDHLLALIFCNLSPALSIGVKIGKQFNTTGKIIDIARDYPDAIKKALKLCKQHNLTSENLLWDRKFCLSNTANSLSPLKIITDADWDIIDHDFSNRSVMINGCILHSVSEGYLEKQHIPLIEHLRDMCLSSLHTGEAIQYIVVDSSKLTGGSRTARINYMQSLMNWYQQHPFRMYILYGINTFTNTAAHLARPFVPFRIKIVDNFDQAFKTIMEDMYDDVPETAKRRSRTNPPEQSSENIEKLLTFIGSIDWEREGVDSNFIVDEDHPFYILFQSIKLIKEELDSLLADREQAEQEKIILESQLRQAHKMEALGTMAGGIAHDFNNILAIILGNAELAQDEINEGATANEYIEQILEATLRAKDIVEQILTFSRKTEKTPKKINIVSECRTSLKFLRSSIPSTIRIRENFALNECFILADPTQFHQLMINLCANAVQAIKGQGTIEISIAAINDGNENATFSSDERSDQHARLSISDTGEGIDPVTLERIFDPFFTTKEVGQGTGLGLSVVHGFVESCNGYITVDSKVDKGTTFHLFFPLSQKSPEITRENHDELPSGDEKVLFIDDEKALVEMGSRMLERLGYTVTSFTESSKAMEAFRATPDAFDLIISDMTMPELTGEELAAEVLQIRPGMPIILCTGYSSYISNDSAKNTGIRELCMKPLRIKQLAQKVRIALDNA